MRNKTGLNILIYLLLFLAGDLVSGLFFDILFRFIHLPMSELYIIPRKLGAFLMIVLLFWLYTKKVLHMDMRDFGITCKLKTWGVIMAILLPAYVVVVYCMIGKTQLHAAPSNQVIAIIVLAVLIALKSGITEEMLFRGFIMKLMEKRWNKAVAIVAPSFLFALVHIPSMETITIAGVLLLIISGTLVGVMFSLAAYQEHSIANSAIIHIIWNLFFVTDILRITTAEGAYGNPLISIIIPSENMLITGSGFGIEASLISAVGYAVVCIVICLMRKKKIEKE
ncbi:MAG: type II CAAX endopeptidase family protein [bacterium]|nr:type II CAAX endopeptidase family protein [bacterium]